MNLSKYFLAVSLILLFIFIPASSAATYDESEKNSFVWIIKPEFEYENIYYCGACNLFGKSPGGNINTSGFEHDTDLLNIETHLIEFKYYDYNESAYVCVGHGFVTSEYFYDENKEIFVIYYGSDGGAGLMYYTLNDFKSNWLFNKNTLIPIRKADSEKVEFDERLGLDYTYVGDKYAIMYGDKFITGFVYDDYKSRGNRYSVNDLIDMKLNGKWGIVNKNGNVAMPFIFDDIEFINDEAAFAKYEGKYGVLDMKNTLIEFVKAPSTGRSFSIYIFISLSIFIILISISKYSKNKNFL